MLKIFWPSKNAVQNSVAIFAVLVMTIVGVRLITGSLAATGATMSLTSSSTSVTPGSTLSITIKEDSGTDPINSVQASLNYDATQLQYAGMTEGTAFPTVAANSTSTAGVIRVGRATQATPVTGSNNVVTVRFTVLTNSSALNISFDKNYSFVVRSTDSTDILTTTTGLTIPGTGPSTDSASMSLSPSSGSAASGSTFAVTVRENSGTAAVNSVQSSVGYDATKLQYVGLTEGGVFTKVVTTDTTTAGLVKLTRSVQAGGAGIAGNNPVVVLNFKAIGTSGTTVITIDKAQSFVTSASSSTNILTTTTGTTYTLSATPAPTTATLSLNPASGSYAVGSSVSVIINASSASSKLTTVQASINYPASQLQYLSTTEGGVYTTSQRTNTATAGFIDIIRSIPGGNAGVVGTNPVVTLNFKVIGTSGAAALSYAASTALFDDSGTGTNIFDAAGSKAASFTITSTQPTCTTNPSQPGTPIKTATAYTTVNISWTASTAGASCTMAGYHVLRDGTKVADVTTGTTYTDSGLLAGSAHSYTVQSYDTAGHSSVVSPALSVSTKVDDMSPTTPIGVTAAAPNAVSVNLGWSPSTDFPNPGAVGVAGYKIYRNGGTTASYTVTTGTTFVDTNVSPSTTYTYSVTSYDKLGNESAPSNVASAKTGAGTPSCTGTPSVPSVQTAATSTMTTTDFSWTTSVAASGCTLAGYHILRNSVVISSTTTTSFHDTGLTPNTSYTYAVQAYDTSGHVSALSTAKTVSTTRDTTAPVAPSAATAQVVSAGKINLSWTASSDNVAVTGYKIYRGGNLIASPSGTGLTYSDTTTVGNTNYSYSISAVDAAGNESSKTTATPNPVHTPVAVDTQAPTAISNLHSLAVTTTSIVIGWNASTDNTAVSGYHVYRAGTLIGNSSGLSYSDTTLTANTTYAYTVKAFDAAGNVSAASTTLSITTLKPTGNLIGDLNTDAVVNLYDLSILLSHWQEVGVPVKFGDINQDGKVDAYDLSSLLSHLGDKQ